MWRHFGVSDRLALRGDADLALAASEPAYTNVVVKCDYLLVPTGCISLHDLRLVSEVFEFLADALIYVHLVFCGTVVLGDLGFSSRYS